MSEYVQQVTQDSLRITGMVSLDTVAGYRDLLVELLASNAADAVKIDLGGIEIKGSAIITLLVSLVRESKKLQKEVIFQHCPEDLLAIARACGVDEILELT